MRWVLWSVFLGLSCSGDDTDTDVERTGQCGAVTEHALTLSVTVEGPDRAAVVGATVTLEERVWDPGSLGSAITGDDGVAVLADLSITSVEDCWGTALDYVAVVELDDRQAEEALNPTLFNAIQAGDGQAARTVELP